MNDVMGWLIIILTVLCATHWLVTPWITDAASDAFEQLFDSVERKGVETGTSIEHFQYFLGILTVFTCAAPLYVSAVLPIKLNMEITEAAQTDGIEPSLLWMGPYLHAACLWIRVLTLLRFPLQPSTWIPGMAAALRLLLARDPDGGMRMVPRPMELAAEGEKMRIKAEKIQDSRRFGEIVSSVAMNL